MRFEIRHINHREEVSSDSDFVVFGRDPSCDVVVRNPRCSRRHASLRVVPEGFHLLDMGSANGVYVHGQKVDDAIIGEGDVFSIGDVFIRILPEEIPQTLAMSRSDAVSRSDATVVDTGLADLGTRRSPTLQVAPPPAAEPPARLPYGRRKDDRSEVPAKATNLAGRILGFASLLIGLCFILGGLAFGRQLGVAALVLPVLGLLSAIAGVGKLANQRWARGIHYALFTVWTLTCVLAPFGVIGFAYQLRGEDRPETDTFFAIVVGIATLLAAVALVAATLLANLYIAAPVPG